MIKDLKELKKFLQLCREQGVDSIKMEGLEIVLGSLPVKESRVAARTATTQEPSGLFDPGKITVSQIVEQTIEADGLSDEDLLYYSANEQ